MVKNVALVFNSRFLFVSLRANIRETNNWVTPADYTNKNNGESKTLYQVGWR